MVSWTVCLDCPPTVIFLISTSWVTRTTGMSHWHPADTCFYLESVFLEYNFQALCVFVNEESFLQTANSLILSYFLVVYLFFLVNLFFPELSWLHRSLFLFCSSSVVVRSCFMLC
jgi:hypothetical protein